MLGTGWPGFDSWQGRQDFSLLYSVLTGFGLTQYPAQWIKRPGREVEHSFPFSAEVKNDGAITLLPHMSSWHSA
jgi:hypothetical protein